jgi:hypothetical protein
MIGTSALQPPDGQGEVLESTRSSTVVVAVLAVLGTFALFLVERRKGVVFESNSWLLWAVYAAFVVVLIHALWHPPLSAGAAWTQMGNRWVETHRLVRIRISTRGRRRYFLSFEDSSGRRIRGYPLAAARSNPAMWELVRSGILHSVTSGECDITTRARQVLDIPRELVTNEASVRRDRSEGTWAAASVTAFGVILVVIGIDASRISWTVVGAVVALLFGWLTYRFARGSKSG